MSEETKKIELSEDTLDNVAGGTFEQTRELFAAVQQLDPEAANAISTQVNANPENAGALMAQGAQDILRKHFGNNFYVTAPERDSLNNRYVVNGQSRSHGQVLNMINAKVQGWEIS